MGSMHHLYHGQSAVERGFEANKKFVVEIQFKDSLKSLRITNDHLTLKNVQARNITIVVWHGVALRSPSQGPR